MAKGTIVVSLRSKGLPSYNKSTIFDVRYQAVQFATEFWDIFLSALVTVACLSWSAWISVGVAVASIAGTVTSNFADATLDMIFVFFMFIVLPLLVLLTFVFRRRDRALRSLADFKASFVSLVLQRPTGSTPHQREAANELFQRAATFIEDLRQYLQHRRPYARHFYLPFRSSTPSTNDPVLRVSRELGLLLRRVHRGVRDLHLACARLRETGVSDAQVAALVSRVEAIHAAVEHLSMIKEMRTPVVLRATTRWFVVVLVPIAMGPYWNHLSIYHSSKAFAGIIGVLLQMAFVGIMDTVVAMEDPFDDTALDAISLFEMLDQVAVMTVPPTDSDGYDVDGLGAGPADPGVGRTSGDAPVAHVAMYVGGTDGSGDTVQAVEAAAETKAAAETAGAAQAGAQQSAGGAAGLGLEPRSGGPASNLAGTMAGGGGQEPQPQRQQQQQQQQPVGASGGGAGPLAQSPGMPAMRGSIITSETAVGPPSAMDPYGGGGGAVIGSALPSITSPPLHDMAGIIRAGGVPPPMPALAGHSMARTASVIGRAGAVPGMY